MTEIRAAYRKSTHNLIIHGKTKEPMGLRIQSEGSFQVFPADWMVPAVTPTSFKDIEMCGVFLR